MPCWLAARKGNFEAFLLIKEKVVGITPLHNAALRGRFDIFQLIFENAKNKNPIDFFGETPHHKAADGTGGGPHKHCQLILDNIDDKNPVNFNGKTPLDLAIKSNHSPVVNILTHN